MNEKELSIYRQKLKSEGKNICYGELCDGNIYDIDKFPKVSNICKKCVAKKAKDYYYSSGGKKYRKVKNEYKKGKSCEECGEDNLILLDFDHLDEKNFNISQCYNSTKLIEEIKLTRMLCIWCHRKKTYEFDVYRVDHKTIEYEKFDEQIENTVLCNGPICEGKYVYRSHFYMRRIGNYHKICKTCTTYKTKQRRLEKIKYINQVKLTIGKCLHCDRKVDDKNFMCFDFDHLRDKSYDISSMNTKVGRCLKKIQEEIDKCQLLCCYCHRIKTAKDQNWDNDITENKEIQNIDEIQKDVKKCSCCYIPINIKRDTCKDCNNGFNELPNPDCITWEPKISKHKCLDCEKEINPESIRCKRCYKKNEKEENIKILKYEKEILEESILYKQCLDCETEIKSVNTRCKPCYNQYKKEKIKTKKCLDCETEINPESTRCKPCYKKHRKDNIKINRCLDCDKQIKPESKRCSDCSREDLKKNPIVYDLPNSCLDCGSFIGRGRERCYQCFRVKKSTEAAEKLEKFKPAVKKIERPDRRKCERPEKEILLKEIAEMGFVKTGKKYGVSDNSIRKWLKSM